MTTIYAVASGSYSDYGINAIFTTEELAQKYIDASGKGYDGRIEEYTLYDDTTVIESRRYVRYWYGDLYSQHSDRSMIFEQSSLDDGMAELVGTQYLDGRDGEDHLALTRRITDNHPDDWWIKRAQKAAYDLMKQIIVLREQDHLTPEQIQAWLNGQHDDPMEE